MGTNGFREDELVSRRVKVGNEWQTRIFPIVAGRLRLAHEENQNLNLQTEMVSWDGQYAVFKCCAVTGKGQFIGYGTANNQRDERLAESLVELAETRSIARALRFAGYGMEYTGAEEVSHVPATEQSSRKGTEPVFPGDNGHSKGEKSKPSSDGIDVANNGATRAPSGAAAGTGSKPSSGGIGQATQAQVRALFALSRKANYQEADIGEMLARYDVSRFEDLSRETASYLIGHLQTEVAA
ncbi:MAG: hypothetical protein ACLP5H_27220 [Desulfomonilaceae bacterium]